MTINKLFLSILFLVVTHLTLAQNSSTCNCSTHVSFKDKTDYETLLPAVAVKKKNASEVIIYTRTDGESGNTHKELKLKFNQRGLVVAKTEYNESGQPHAQYDFERNGPGKIVKQRFNYLDSTTALTVAEFTDYYYDLKARLIKIKKRNEKGMVMPDIMADFTKYEYDNTNRITKEVVQYYGNSGRDTSSHITTYSYNDSKLTGQSQVFEHNKVSRIIKSQYDKHWKPLRETTYSSDGKTAIRYAIFEYDSQGRLNRLEVKGDGITTECLNNGAFIEIYTYTAEGLISSIVRQYEEKKCEEVFEYNPALQTRLP
ncbi:hypothetical protein [Ohtaekwangia sp.]|uniref:hypothetical protein n=1 Tax=Ohtaekwangia sp. TaxID=2066019 RepID=UPI002FDDB3B4